MVLALRLGGVLFFAYNEDPAQVSDPHGSALNLLSGTDPDPASECGSGASYVKNECQKLKCTMLRRKNKNFNYIF